ncbi:MAG: hypothetical protein A2048_00290 [Deltaproteobacteria bacterium GWA2_45_12]|nr:MAG: hypothetical protein A2048_00290 [Deltaproteobacteria bacterium GWA2_45_12]
MNLSTIDLNLLVAFEAIYAERNISRAAEKMGLSQPAMSGALARLKDVYKDELFVRSSKGMIPTHKAEKLIEGVKKALTHVRDSLAEETPFDPQECRETFRLAMSDWLALHLLPKISLWLRREAPGMNLIISHLSPPKMHEALMVGELDLGISGQPHRGSGTYRQKLYTEHYQCVVWKGHPKIKKILSLKDYVAHPHVLFSPEGKGSGAVDKALAKKGLTRRVTLRVAYSVIIPVVIRNTDLIATIPAPIARLFSDTMDILMFPPPISLPGHDMVQYWNKENHTNPAHRWFRNGLAQLCRKFS